MRCLPRVQTRKSFSFYNFFILLNTYVSFRTLTEEFQFSLFLLFIPDNYEPIKHTQARRHICTRPFMRNNFWGLIPFRTWSTKNYYQNQTDCVKKSGQIYVYMIMKISFYGIIIIKNLQWSINIIRFMNRADKVHFFLEKF